MSGVGQINKSITDPRTVALGTQINAAVVQVLHSNKMRAGYRIIAAPGNAGRIYHGRNANVNNTSHEFIDAEGIIEDSGNWESIYRGEVWLIASIANQECTVIEIIANSKPPGY